MHTLAVLRVGTGEPVALGHGGLIGRLFSADLHVNDARVSEAHAMISLRGRDVRLLALRGRFRVEGRWLDEVALTPGLRLSLAPGVELEVVEVLVPERVLAVSAPGLARQVLNGVSSLFGGTAPRVVAGWDASADAHLWPTGEAWMRSGPEPIPVSDGDAWEAGGVRFVADWLEVEGAHPTRREADYAQPLRLTARYDTVHLARAGAPVVVLTGHIARVVSELAVAKAPLPWEELARATWPEGDRDQLRHRWDMQLRRLRQKLAANGIRPDLVRADGSGLIELVLGVADVVVDDT